jgi:hypothetical protein
MPVEDQRVQGRQLVPGTVALAVLAEYVVVFAAAAAAVDIEPGH